MLSFDFLDIEFYRTYFQFVIRYFERGLTHVCKPVTRNPGNTG